MLGQRRAAPMLRTVELEGAARIYNTNLVTVRTCPELFVANGWPDQIQWMFTPPFFASLFHAEG